MAKKSPYLDEISQRQRELQAEIKRLSETVQKGSPRMVARNNTLDPPEDIRSGRQRRKLHVAVSHGQVRNARRELRENTLMLCLLVGCIAASFFWILNLLHSS